MNERIGDTMKANYQQIKAALTNLEPFTGNSLRGERWGNEYRVISYQTLIATNNTDTGEKWVSPRKYSLTTTKQQNIIKCAWDVN